MLGCAEPMNQAFYLQKIKEDLSKRQRANPAYSLRAYSRDLGVHPSTLSQVLLGKRPLPLKFSHQVSDRLRLNAKERTLFSDSLGRKHIALDQISLSKEDDRYLLDEAYFQIIAEWEHYAVLTLFDCSDFTATAKDISRRLNLPDLRTEVVVQNLLRFGLLKQKDGKLSKAHAQVRTTEDVASSALKASHLETLELGKQKIESVALELRDFSSMMVAVDLEKIPEMKVIIREFRQKASKLLKTGKPAPVFQLGIQFYPLTDVSEAASRQEKL